ncbi:MAG TPA: replicative DNA helicase [bacterium]|nr:replicative DNA helicase [bacterium]HOL48150.1 replicative DNA helicase [bacterium]HPQ18494.1 replicative DNA helicase [bacterium]
MSANFERIPPHSIEAEQSVLGAIFINENCIEKIIDYIPSEEYFYKDNHKIIYKTILNLYSEKKAIDALTIAEELEKNGNLEKIGGSVYLVSLADILPSIVNVEEYAKIVRDKAILRELIKVSNEIQNKSYSEELDAERLLQLAELEIFELANKQLRKGYISINDVLEPLLKKIEDLYTKKREVTGIKTNYTELDKITSGLQPSDLIIIAARPGMGKTSFGLNIAYNVAKQEREQKDKKGVAIFSLEMSDEQVVMRFISHSARLNLKRIRDGSLDQHEWQRLILTIDELSQIPLFIVDRPGISILELQSIARRLKKEQNIQLIVVDYLQLLEVPTKTESRQQDISFISRALKNLARELKIPIIALSQLNRSVENRKPPIPMLSDLRESGAIEQDADLVIFIYRDEYYYKDESQEKGIAKLLIEKHRNGPTGMIELAFLKDYASFENLEKKTSEPSYESTYYED